jgi:predicted PurR-regulated permease PerM
MKRGGAGTVLLVIFFLLIIVVLLFPNQVEQFLSQFNISLGNGTVNLGQVFQQFINGLQGIKNATMQFINESQQAYNVVQNVLNGNISLNNTYTSSNQNNTNNSG